MILFLDKIQVYTYGDRLSFGYPGDLDQSTWSCYPTYDLETEEFLEIMAPIMQKHGWITPRDLQEQACKHGYATYSKKL